MHDVVYLVGPTGPHDDLRYSLRSLANVDHGDVWIVGHRPKWLRNVAHVPSVKAGGSKWRRIRVDLLAACLTAGFPSTFSYWNDDMFAVAPTGIPVWHRGPIVPKRPPLNRRNRDGGIHRECVSATGWLLTQWGCERPLNYEVHVPQVLDRDALVDIGARGERSNLDGIQLRSLYSNMMRLGGDLVADVKIGSLTSTWADGQRWVSTSDRSFSSGAVGRRIRELFPEPSIYEVS